MFASYYLLLRYFPWKQITWNFLSQFQLFKGLVHMTIVSPAYVGLNLLFLLDPTDPEYSRDTTYLRWAMPLSITIIVHNWFRIVKKGEDYHLTSGEVMTLIGHMGRPGREHDVFPPFYLVFCDLHRATYGGEYMALNNVQITQIAESLWNNSRMKHLVMRPDMVLNVVA